jgi:hypothetical protein
MFFLVMLLIQLLKKLKYFVPNLENQLKNKYPPLGKNVTEGYHSLVTHVIYHFCDTSLITACAIYIQCKVSCCLHMYFLWRQHFPPDKSENDQDNDSDWCTYCIDIRPLTLLFSLQYLSDHALEMTINLYYLIILELFCFWFTQTSCHSKFCLGPPPAINNDCSLSIVENGFRSNVEFVMGELEQATFLRGEWIKNCFCVSLKVLSMIVLSLSHARITRKSKLI